MADEIVVNIIETKCQPEDEEKFNKWYNEVHIPCSSSPGA
jgi:antibiotic biosynthesis monooxygenase (ABM) superfamily enzyme